MKRAALVIVGLMLAANAAHARPSAGLPNDQMVTRLVGWDEGATAELRQTLLEAMGARVTGRVPLIRMDRIELPAERVAALRAQPAVLWVERNHRLRLMDEPNDPYLQFQWSLYKMGVLKAWEHETGTRSPVTVAVVDSGVESVHPDLIGRIIQGHDFVSADDDPADTNGHGTHVAGIIAALQDNNFGVAGISWGAKVLAIRACAEQGTCDAFAVSAGIAEGIVSGARVVNLSLGGGGTSCPAPFLALAQVAAAKGVVLVAASGNSAQDQNPAMYPAACDGYLGVGATTNRDKWAPFSSHGPYVDVSAPGVDIWSTLPAERSSPTTPGFGAHSGTSMAAPQVSGLAALLFSAHPDWTAEEVIARILETAVDLGRAGRDDYFGAGRISVARAIKG
ncbi:MAG TPA: S8 family serine peptidase [Actinomycetota bacterium]|nr:S8 family serine peptidase [Actinomycetota bacterium]